MDPIRLRCEPGARGMPGIADPHGPVCEEEEHTRDVHRRCRQRSRHPARGVSRLAPHEPRWTDQALLEPILYPPLSEGPAMIPFHPWLGERLASGTLL